eukprot:GEMP01015968.1.p1 GENE.GEMP01015968.1~~GEMP01015968.1.p1  ORF type:complete len:711 (+),score=152.86 GEMP01015968.1:66-2198(+)
MEDDENVEFKLTFGKQKAQRQATLEALEKERRNIPQEGWNAEQVVAYNDANRRALESNGDYDLTEVVQHYLKPYEWTTVDEKATPPPWEEFISPKIEVKNTPDKGRGLFAKSTVSFGELLFAEKALHVGLNTTFEKDVEAKVESAEECVQKRFFRLSGKDGAKDVESIAKNNRHSTQLVNTHTAPVEISSDTERSGIWLTAALVNHSCLPNVQRLVCDQWFFLRAIRNITEGDEFVDGYIELQQPHEYRQNALAPWGFTCSCARCDRDARAMSADEVNSILAKAQVARTEVEVEDVLGLVDRTVLIAAGRQCAPDDLSLSRMINLREGFEPCVSVAEERWFKRQHAIALELSASFGNIFKQHVLVLKREGYRNSASIGVALESYARVLQVVIPNSEYLCQILNEALSMRLLANSLVVQPHVIPSATETLRTFHCTYGGGTAVWNLLSETLYPVPVRQDLCKCGITVTPSFVPLTVPTPKKEKTDSEGFAETLRGRFANSTSTSTTASTKSASSQKRTQTHGPMTATAPADVSKRDGPPEPPQADGPTAATSREATKEAECECGPTGVAARSSHSGAQLPAGESNAENAELPAGESNTRLLAGEPNTENARLPAGESIAENARLPAGESIAENVSVKDIGNEIVVTVHCPNVTLADLLSVYLPEHDDQMVLVSNGEHTHEIRLDCRIEAHSTAKWSNKRSTLTIKLLKKDT